MNRQIHESDDLPLNQMVLRRNTGVNTEDEYAEDDDDDKNYKDIITGKHKAIRQKKSVGMAEDLDDEEKVESKGNLFY